MTLLMVFVTRPVSDVSNNHTLDEEDKCAQTVSHKSDFSFSQTKTFGESNGGNCFCNLEIKYLKTTRRGSL